MPQTKRVKIRDLVCEDFDLNSIKVSQKNKSVHLTFNNTKDAIRAYFVIKNAFDLGIPIRIGMDTRDVKDQ